MTVSKSQLIDIVEGTGLAGFIDVETTGLSPVQHEIIEFAICLFRFERSTGEIVGIVDEYVGLREPDRPIPWQASRIHGLYDRDVQGQRLDEARIMGILNQAEFLVAHNASFDRGFVERLFCHCQGKPWLCSMRGINWKQKGFASKALQNLLAAHRINVARAHRAQDDVKAAITLLSQRTEDGYTYFYELIRE